MDLINKEAITVSYNLIKSENKYREAINALDELLAKFAVEGWSDLFHYEQERDLLKQTSRWLTDMQKCREEHGSPLPSDRVTVCSFETGECVRCSRSSEPQFQVSGEQKAVGVCIECALILTNGGEWLSEEI